MTWDEKLIYSGIARPAVEILSAIVFLAITHVDFSGGAITLRGVLPWSAVYLAVGGGLFGLWVAIGIIQGLAQRNVVRDYRAHRLATAAHQAAAVAHQADTADIMDSLADYVSNVGTHVRAIGDVIGVPNPYTSKRDDDDEREQPGDDAGGDRSP